MDIVTVQVERNANTKIVVEVPEYEVPVLEAIHGDENIHELDRKKGDAAFNADEAYLSLEGKYGRSNDESGNVIFHSVYPSVGALRRQFKEEKKTATA